MDIYFYNTLTRKKDKFEPLDPKEIRIYSCGPTVYKYENKHISRRIKKNITL